MLSSVTMRICIKKNACCCHEQSIDALSPSWICERDSQKLLSRILCCWCDVPKSHFSFDFFDRIFNTNHFGPTCFFCVYEWRWWVRQSFNSNTIRFVSFIDSNEGVLQTIPTILWQWMFTTDAQAPQTAALCIGWINRWSANAALKRFQLFVLNCYWLIDIAYSTN